MSGVGRLARQGRPVAEEVGSVIERFAALTAAGVAPGSAWAHLAVGAADPFLVAVAARVSQGAPVTEALARELATVRQRHPERGRAWAVFAAAWFAAVDSGAPLADCLAGIAELLRGLGGVEREIRVALAGPVATSRLVFVLPLVSFAGGTVLGLDPIGVMISNPAALACALVAALLLVVAAVWSRRMLARARRIDPAPGLLLDLTAIALGGGGSVPQARAGAERALARAALVCGPAEAAARDAVLALAMRAGAPPGDLLRREAVRLRRDTVGAAAERAAGLGVWLLLPLGLCVLPAFVLLTAAPILIGVISSTHL